MTMRTGGATQAPLAPRVPGLLPLNMLSGPDRAALEADSAVRRGVPGAMFYTYNAIHGERCLGAWGRVMGVVVLLLVGLGAVIVIMIMIACDHTGRCSILYCSRLRAYTATSAGSKVGDVLASAVVVAGRPGHAS
jgi:hypothetical protein